MAKAKRGKSNRPKKPKVESGTQSTGDVAEILEAKYHIMQTFVDRHLPEIADELAGGMAGALESLMSGGSPDINPFGKATSHIKQKFSEFLSSKAMDGLTGIPTKASLDGVNHRLKSKRGPPRPSFTDTGAYETQFQDWIEE